MISYSMGIRYYRNGYQTIWVSDIIGMGIRQYECPNVIGIRYRNGYQTVWVSDIIGMGIRQYECPMV